MLSEIAKANDVPDANDQGAPVIGTQVPPKKVDVHNTVVCVSNLPRVRGAVVKH